MLARCLVLLVVTACAASCRSSQPTGTAHGTARRHTASRAVLGTTFRVTVYADPRAASAAMSAAFERLSAVDAAFVAGLGALSSSPERRAVKVPDDLFDILQHARKFSAATRGAFDVTRGPYVELWRRAAAAGRTPSQAEIEDARLRVGWEKLHLDAIERTVTLTVPGMRLDLDGIASGFALDAMMQQLRLHGCDASRVEAADVQFVGALPPGAQWSVPLRGTAGPKGPKSMQVDRMAVAFGGSARRNASRKDPPIDPVSGRAVAGASPLVVVARSAAAAECVAAAAAVLGPAGTDLLTRAEPGARVRFGQGPGGSNRPTDRRRRRRCRRGLRSVLRSRRIVNVLDDDELPHAGELPTSSSQAAGSPRRPRPVLVDDGDEDHHERQQPHDVQRRPDFVRAGEAERHPVHRQEEERGGEHGEQSVAGLAPEAEEEDGGDEAAGHDRAEHEMDRLFEHRFTPRPR